MTEFLDDFSPLALARAIETSAVDGCRAWGLWPRMEVHDDADAVWIMSDVRFPVFNGVLKARTDAIDRILAPFGDLPLIWWTGPDMGEAVEEQLLARGFVHAAEPAGMVLDLDTLRDTGTTPPGLVVEEVRDEPTLRDWSRVSSTVFEFPGHAADAWHAVHAASGLGPDAPWRNFLARLDGEAVATSSLFTGSGVASIASVATLPHVRHRGIGRAVSLHPLRRARGSGFRTATLCASDAGEAVYRRMGFREICRMGMYLRARHG